LLLGKQLLSELAELYPQIVSCTYTKAIVYSQADSAGAEKLYVLLDIKAKSLKQSDRYKITAWLKKRLEADDLQVYFDE
jgi:hypothetical protein